VCDDVLGSSLILFITSSSQLLKNFRIKRPSDSQFFYHRHNQRTFRFRVLSTFSKSKNLRFQVFEHFQKIKETLWVQVCVTNLQTNQWAFAKTPGKEPAVKGG
jgi:hypothetical protein